LNDVRRPRLLIVGAFPPPGRNVFGGQVTSCRSLLQSSLPTRVSLDALDSTQVSNPPPSMPARLMLAIRRFFRYVYRFERRRPDGVLLFAAIGASLAEKGVMAWYARLRGVPALMFPRGGSIVTDSYASPLTRWWVRLAFGGAATVLCQSSMWHDFAVQVLGLPASRAPIIQNWTATPELLAIGRARQSHQNRPVGLLFLGWLDREKGVAELLEACRRLWADTATFTLDFAGEGNFSTQARSFVERHDLAAVVRFRGWLRDEALAEALAAADVLVLPSWAEGLPNAMIEAMAARLAVVVTSVGSVPHVVTDGREALMVPARDTDALRGALGRVIDDPDLRRRLGDAAIRLAEEEFGVEPAVDKILAALSEAIHGSPIPSTQAS
jgi:glycosyltransferase involved in cell wall biosynthesis